MAMWPDFRVKHRRQHGGDAVDHAIDIERHGPVEAVEVDVADVERHVHAGAEKSEVDGPELALDRFADRLLQFFRLATRRRETA